VFWSETIGERGPAGLMRVFVASPLHSYTGGRAEVEGRGSSLADVLADLDRRYPGIRFRVVDEQGRVRPHIRFFVGGQLAERLSHPIGPGEDVHIIAALSGGACPRHLWGER